MSRWLLSFALLLSFNFAAPAQTNPDEAALRTLAAQYFETLTKGDVAAHMALWTGLEQERAERQAQWERRLATETYSYTPPTLSRLIVRSTLSEFYAKSTRRNRNRQTNQETVTEVHLAFTLVKEEVWRFVAERPAVQALQMKLQLAPEAERARLLETERDLVTPELLQLCVSQSDRYFASGRFQPTQTSLQLALLIAEFLADRSAQAGIWQHLGIAQFSLQDFRAALASHQRALALETELGHKPEQASALSSLALVYERLQQPAQALAHYQKALALYEQLNARRESAYTLETLGGFYYEQGQYAQARAAFQRSLDYLPPMPSSTRGNTRLKLARLAYEMGDDHAALQHYQLALTDFEELKEHANRGYTLHSLGNLFYTQGDLSQALLYYQQSLAAETQAQHPGGQISALQGIGLVHSLNGNYALALPVYEQHLNLQRALKDPAQLASALQKLAATRFALGEYQTALQLYEEALQVRTAQGDRYEMARALLDVGITQVSLNQFAAALTHEERSRTLFAELNQPAGVASALLSLAFIHYLQQDFAQALAQADEAARFAKQANDQELLWQARYRAGKCQQQLQQLPLARQAFTEAVAIIEALRPKPGQGVATNHFNQNKQAPFQALVDVLLALNQGSEAFHVSERAKQRSLLTTIRNGRVWITQEMAAIEQKRERALLDELGLLSAQLNRENEKPEPNSARVQMLKQRLAQTNASYDSFLQQLYRLHPRLKTLRGESAALAAGPVAALLKDESTAFLAFSETETGVALFAFAKPDRATAPLLKVYALSTNRADLSHRLSQLQTALAERSAAAETQLRELHELLLAPAQEQLQGKTRLLIAPDGALWKLPFSALRDARQRYLIETAALSYVAALSAVPLLTQVRPRSPAAQNWLALAQPTLSPAALQQLNTRLRREPADRPAETGSDVEAIGALFAATLNRSYREAAATKQRLQTEARQARWLHLAAPVVLDELNPFFSGAALASSPDAPGLATAGWLAWRELSGFPLKARLTVLAATEMAPLREPQGRALSGTSWAFMLAGCPNVLVKQEPGEAAATTELLRMFYQQQLTQPNLSSAQAWQNAVRDLRQNPAYQHPFYWAGFSLLGAGIR